MAKQNGTGLAKPVMVAETGEIYASRSKAAQALGCSASAIQKAIKFGKLINGYHLFDTGINSDEDAPSDTTDDNGQAGETAPDDERGVLLKQLETKDKQIKKLQSSISCLLKQLEDKHVLLGEVYGETLALQNQLNSTQSYYTKALSLYEKRVNELAAYAHPAAQRPLSRRQALRIALFGGNAISQYMPDGREV